MKRARCEIKSSQEVLNILRRARIGHLATLDVKGYPYVTPVNFVFCDDHIYFHSSPTGEKMENLRRNPRVCFEVDIPLSYLGVDFNPEKNPCRAHQLYHSVIVRGTARILSEGARKAEILNQLVAKYEGSRSFCPVTQGTHGFAACRVVEIGLETVSGKSELAQSSPQLEYRQFILQRLVERGWPVDIEAVEFMKKIAV